MDFPCGAKCCGSAEGHLSLLFNKPAYIAPQHDAGVPERHRSHSAKR